MTQNEIKELANRIVNRQHETGLLYKTDLTLTDGTKRIYLKEVIDNYVVIYENQTTGELKQSIVEFKNIEKIEAYYLDIEREPKTKK